MFLQNRGLLGGSLLLLHRQCSSVVNGSSMLPTSDKVAGPGIASRSPKFNFFLHCEHIARKKMNTQFVFLIAIYAPK